MRKMAGASLLVLMVVLGATQVAGASTHSAFPSRVQKVMASGRCNWLKPLVARAGLPSIFVAIAARESGCAKNGVHVSNRTDLSTSRFGLNFRGSMPRYWKRLCGVSNWQLPGRSIALDLKCVKAAYHAAGLRPWAVR